MLAPKQKLIFLLILVEMVFVGVFSFGPDVRAGDFDEPPISIADKKIKAAGIPIDGIAMDDGRIVRIDFKPEATQEQRNQAWDIARNFDYEAVLVDIEKTSRTQKLVTFFGDEVPELNKDGQITIANVNGSPYLYFRANGETHHILGNASFEISSSETIDALSGEKMQVGDFVIGMIDKNLGNGPSEAESSLHGVWVKWSSVKKELIKELQASLVVSGVSSGSSGYISGVDISGAMDMVQNALAGLGIMIQDGLTSIKNLAVEKFFAKIARVEKLEMVDQATGRIYCTWLEYGELKKIEGACDTQEPEQQTVPELPMPGVGQNSAPEEPIIENHEPQPEETDSESEELVEEPTPITEPEPEITPEPEPTQPAEVIEDDVVESEPPVEEPVIAPEPIEEPVEPVESPEPEPQPAPEPIIEEPMPPAEQPEEVAPNPQP